MRESQILNEAYEKFMSKEHPLIPVHAIGKATFKVTKNKERVILDKITKFLNWSGHLGLVVDSAASYSQTAGRFIKSQTTAGCSDMIACIDGKFYAIELKRVYETGKDKQSDIQKKFENRVNIAGGSYVIVNNFMTFYKWYEGL